MDGTCNEQGREGLPPRDHALALLHEFTGKPGLIKHALAVEAAMRAYAERSGADADGWGLVGLLHDFDYERWPGPADHPVRGAAILRERGFPEWFCRAILSHAATTGVERRSRLEHTLFACDELCGFLIACALVAPGRSLDELEPASVRRKLRSRNFAASVSRDDIAAGAAACRLDLDEHIAFVLAALRSIAPALGLARSEPEAAVVTTYLEMTDPGQLRPAAPPTGAVELRRVDPPQPELNRHLYATVGRDWRWTDRVGWTPETWRAWLDRDGVETWVAYGADAPVGYFELERRGDEVEIVYLGLVPGCMGRGLGGWLLTRAIERGFALAPRRVWVHTCTLDHPGALANYEARGLRPYKRESRT